MRLAEVGAGSWSRDWGSFSKHLTRSSRRWEHAGVMARDTPKCPQCGGSNFEPGVLQLTGFMPKKRKFLSWAAGGVPVSASACAECGHLQLSVDAAKLAKIVGDRALDRRRGFPITPLSPPDGSSESPFSS